MPTILILEDEPFIALDIETVLEEYGQRNFVTLSTGSDAVSWLKENSPSVAIVDPRLSDGVCTAVARHLVNCDIPFIVYSGESEIRFRAGTRVRRRSSSDEAGLA
ncbi:response regulator [Rhizobium beringeri]